MADTTTPCTIHDGCWITQHVTEVGTAHVDHVPSN